MKPLPDMTQIEVAAYVVTLLESNHIPVTLSGGAATGYYSNNLFVSKDIDLVNEYRVNPARIKSVMINNGFVEDGRHFIFPGTHWIVEFPPGPLSVGMEPVSKTETIQLDTGSLRIISATDCVKDRLAAYYLWKDLQCLVQARMVRNNAKVDLEEIERWSRNEGKFEEFKIFLSEG